jgi:hypothetical protein
MINMDCGYSEIERRLEIFLDFRVCVKFDFEEEAK